VLVFKLELPENDENLFRMISDKKIPKFSVKKRTFKIAPFPFDNGSTNCAYYSLATTFQPELNVFFLNSLWMKRREYSKIIKLK